MTTAKICFKKNLAGFKSHLVLDGRLLTQISPGTVKTSRSIAILQDPVSICETCATIFYVKALRRSTRRCRTGHELEGTVSLRQNFVIDENVTVVHSAKNVLLRDIKWIPHKELAICRSSDHLNLEQRDPRVLTLGKCDASLSIFCGIDKSGGIFFI